MSASQQVNGALRWHQDADAMSGQVGWTFVAGPTGLIVATGPWAG